MSDEINPAQQRGISVDVLAERLSNHTQAMSAQFDALHHHFAALEVKVDSYGDKVAGIETALHEHVAMQHHAGTRDAIVQITNRQLDAERKFGELDRQLAGIREEKLVENAANQARQKQRSQGLSAVDKAIGLAMGAAVILIQVLK
jgi:hypothetical protein